MKISFGSKGDFDGSLEWLSKLTEQNPNSTSKRIGDEGVKSLSRNTPRDTGETASGWNYVVEEKNNVVEVAWINTAHPNLNVNLATLIDLGHGTRNGGYVQPRPYIKESMDPIFNNVGDRLYRELTK